MTVPRALRVRRLVRTTWNVVVAAGMLASCSEQAPVTPKEIRLVSGHQQSGVVASALPEPVTVQVIGSDGRGMPGVAVTFSVTVGGGAASAATQLTNADGNASVTWTVGSTAGLNQLEAFTAVLPDTRVTFTATGRAGPAAAIVPHAGADQVAIVGLPVPFVPAFRVNDQYGNGVAGVSVSFVATAGILAASAATTGPDGVASPGPWVLGTVPGPQSIAATVSGIAEGATITVTAIAGPPAALAIADGNGQSAVVGTPVAIPPAVRVTDVHGNPVGSASVNFAVVLGGGSIGSASVATNAAGVATIASWTLGTRAGSQTLRAVLPSSPFLSVTFTATGTPGAAAAIAVNDGDSQVASPGTAVGLAPSAVVRDQYGNGVGGVTVEFSIAEGDGTLAGASQVSNASGVARVGSWVLGGAGAHRLSASIPGLQVSPASFAASASSDCAVSGLAFASTVNASLATTDCAFDGGHYAEQFLITVQAVTRVRLSQSSAAFDTYLILRDAAGAVVASDDDGGEGTNSTIAATLGAGTYRVYATSYAAGATGAFSLTLDAADTDCAGVGTVTSGSLITGTLTPDDCVLGGGYFADPWILTLTRASQLSIDLGSSFDTYLYVTYPNGSIIVQDDDGGDGGNSRSRVSLAAGTYVVWATSFWPNVTGSYSLSVSPLNPACGAATPLDAGTTAAGALASSDCVLGGGYYADIYQFTLTQSARVRIAQNSTTFDSFLVLGDATGASIAADDDSGGNFNSLITTELEAGTYYLHASSYYSFASGSYTLSWNVAGGCSAVGSLVLPQAVSGALAGTDCTLEDGSRADRWDLTLASATTVDLDLTSTAFDAFMYVVNAAGNTVAWDDDGGEGTNARIQATLPAGTYRVVANAWSAEATGDYQLTAAAAAAAPLNLVVDQIHVTQSSQDSRGQVPIVAGRDALVRVFVRANSPNSVQPAVRLQIFNGTTLLETRSIAAAGASTPAVISEGSLAASWNTVLAAALVQPGLRLLADVDPGNTIAEASETDNTFPASGTGVAVNVVTVPVLNLTLVPVLQSVNGRLGNVTTGNEPSFTSMLRAIWPLAALDVIVRAPYTTSLPALQSADQNGSWSALHSELNALRLSEAPSRYYYGVVNTSYASGQRGLGSFTLPVSLGWDDPEGGGETLAHELGHNFGRRHAPCGGAGGPDRNYPYPNGAIGAYGYDPRNGKLHDRAVPDLMSYCDNPWVSDYNYRAVMQFLRSSAAVVADEGTQPSVVVWGRIVGGRAIIEPAFGATAPATKATGGRYTLRARDDRGRIVMDVAFEPAEMPDAPDGARHFALVIPRSSFNGAALAELEVFGPGVRRASRRASARDAAGTGGTATGVRRAGQVDITWDAAAFPMAVVRTPSGEILSFARNGHISLPAAAAELEVELLDGVSSRRVRVSPR